MLVKRLATELLSVDDLEINLIQSRREEIEPQLIEQAMLSGQDSRSLIKSTEAKTSLKSKI